MDSSNPRGPSTPVARVAFRGADGNCAVLYNHSTHTSAHNKATCDPRASMDRRAGTRAGAGGRSGFSRGRVRLDPQHYGGQLCRGRAAHEEGRARCARPRGPRPLARFAVIKRPFSFKVRTFDEQVEDAKVLQYCQKYLPGAAESVANVFRTMRRELAPRQGEPRETWLQAIALDDVAVVGVPAEYFTGLGVDIKKRSPFPHTVVVELANDWIGYCRTESRISWAATRPGWATTATPRKVPASASRTKWSACWVSSRAAGQLAVESTKPQRKKEAKMPKSITPCFSIRRQC